MKPSLPNIDSLVEEVLIEILKRLSIKFAHRCKRVSKRWNETISTLYFYKCHEEYRLLTNSKPRLLLIYQFHKILHNSSKQNYFQVSLANLDPPRDYASVKTYLRAPPLWLSSCDKFNVLASNNGVLLCSATPAQSSTQYYVCHLVYRKWFAIPQPPTTLKRYCVGLICSASNHYPSKNFVATNNKNRDFGDSLNYKIVRIPGGRKAFLAEVYNSETGEWTVDVHQNMRPICANGVKEGSAVPCNGLLFWRCPKELLVYDQYNNGFKFIKLLDIMHSTNCYFGECNGRLRCATCVNRVLSIWELEDCDIYAGNWRFLQAVELTESRISQGNYGGDDLHVISIVFHPLDEEAVVIVLSELIILFNTSRKIETYNWGRILNVPPEPLAFPIVLP